MVPFPQRRGRKRLQPSPTTRPTSACLAQAGGSTPGAGRAGTGGQGVYLSSLLNWGWASAISRLLLNTALLQQEQSEKTELLPRPLARRSDARPICRLATPGKTSTQLQGRAWPADPRPAHTHGEKGRGQEPQSTLPWAICSASPPTPRTLPVPASSPVAAKCQVVKPEAEAGWDVPVKGPSEDPQR
jgi:hypothetical protein